MIKIIYFCNLFLTVFFPTNIIFSHRTIFFFFGLITVSRLYPFFLLAEITVSLFIFSDSGGLNKQHAILIPADFINIAQIPR